MINKKDEFSISFKEIQKLSTIGDIRRLIGKTEKFDDKIRDKIITRRKK